MPRTRILALDLATVGAAAWTVGELVRVDTLHFDLRERAGITKAKQAGAHGALFVALHALVTDLIDLADPEVIAVEKDTGRGYGPLVMLGGLRAIAKLAAAERGIRCITDRDASTARSLAGVGGGATKKEVAGARARMLFGLTTQTDDEVDAVILHAAVEARLKAEAIQALLKGTTRRKAPRALTKRRAT